MCGKVVGGIRFGGGGKRGEGGEGFSVKKEGYREQSTKNAHTDMDMSQDHTFRIQKKKNEKSLDLRL